MSQDLDLPTYEDVEEAAGIIKGVANRTPMQTSRFLDSQLGVNVFVKCENFQRTGAFKFRGGYNSLSHLTPKERDQGVITCSSGNHAQGIALSSRLLGMKATIIMPQDAPELKVNATKGYGGNVIFYDRYTESRETIAEDIQAKTGAHFIPPYNDKYVIAGQGTVGKELIEDVIDGGHGPLDYLFVCVGGSGLISGCALAAEKLAPGCKVIGVEPEAGDDAKQSLEKGEIVRIETPQTIADGAQTQRIGDVTFEIMKKKVEKIITVTDEQLVDELRFFGERMKLFVEPTGCLGLAGLRKLVDSGEVPANSNCGVIVSGGNVDVRKYCELLG
mmetsp:Transcript_12610/g.19540  ORF Transcript_12610/g.19540 Transcript_12610/m.19540 type:complete len:331 (-) Transcript_12610:136-1128(-)|eukprot:CAMPEP_0195281324 /NCGR_PEP_ID=MMETSP0707-20130614/682_1 /TAXON_ID=33640 /ORGANISM="Asterionellopsis glacialis, Strain CCMP134" /LENGTH=330 /DNA_ID=CAMNT_0040340199 /DNA_START=309 /DNA_END=1301 /DNA_ORIENTATION=+